MRNADDVCMTERIFMEILLKAYAKINLSLDVTGVRDNGYHDLRMIMQTINLYDRISVKRIQKDEIIISANHAVVQTDSDNLIYKACMRFFEAAGISSGLFITLDKRIPVAAGLAGGSADAAATLKALNMLFDAGLSVDELKKIGVKLGADVPFMIEGGTCLCEGIGEIITDLCPLRELPLVIVKPARGISTKLVYDMLEEPGKLNHPDVDGMVRAVNKGDIPGVVSRLGNVLESVTEKEVPEVTSLKKRLMELGAMGSLMSGSGTTVFGIFDKKDKAQEAYYALKNETLENKVYLTSTIGKNAL